MILKRKMYNKLLTLKKELNGKKAFLIEGARRIGKSTICEEFGKNEYKSYILIDFAKCPDEVKGYFQKHMNDLDTFFMLLSTYYGVKLFERESLIILTRCKCTQRQENVLNISLPTADMTISKQAR